MSPRIQVTAQDLRRAIGHVIHRGYYRREAELREAKRRGWAARDAYAARLHEIVAHPLQAAELPIHLVTFSGRRDLPEQVASLRSLLEHAGAPRSVTIVSDGTHDDGQRALLEEAAPRTHVVNWREVTATQLPPTVAAYAERQAMGKKLAVELALPFASPTLYVDADVLFFSGARELPLLASAAEYPRYLLDDGPWFDVRLLEGEHEQLDPANGGVLLIPRPLAWDAALARLARLDDGPEFHSEQTLLHLALRSAGARPLDPERYVVSLCDRYSVDDKYADKDIVLRHYTSPVRHKFWCAVDDDLHR
jgi:hypothetical protein